MFSSRPSSRGLTLAFVQSLAADRPKILARQFQDRVKVIEQRDVMGGITIPPTLPPPLKYLSIKLQIWQCCYFEAIDRDIKSLLDVRSPQELEEPFDKLSTEEMAAMNYQDHHPREMSSYNSLQSQIRRRPSLLSEFHGGAAERERERSGKEFYSRGLDPLRMHTSNHHPDNEISVAKRRRLDIDNDTKFRPVHENSTSTRVVTSSANQPEVKKEPFIPKVENVSPTPCDDESPSKVSKEGLLQAMEKMDREIQMVESQIVNLKKKKQELEQRTSQPREEEKAVADADWEPKQENIVQTIYAENQRKAEDAHKMLSKSGVQNILPLYNQMSDEPNHKEVLKKNYELSRRFILYFKQQAAERNLREKNYCQLYNRRMEAWENRMEKIESNPKKKAKDAKTREFFEKQFPEIRKQREQQERFSSRAGTRSWGNIARSEAELAEIVDGLNEQEANERHMRSLTVIPPMLLEKEQRSVNFVNNNGLVEDAMQEYKDRQRMNMWTNEEREIFREKFSQHPKNFGAIAAFLERKSVPDCVLYYYQNKKRENYKQRKQQVKRKKTLPQKASSSINRNHDDEDKDDKEDGTSQDPKKKDGGDDKEGVNGGGSQNGETSNGPPMSVPTNCALCHHSLDAYTMSRPLSKSNCELLGLNVNEVTANMRVCSKCRFRSLRKSPCPVTSCKTARRKAKRLKPLPTKWFEISEEQRSIISQELGSSELPDWSEKEINAAKQAMRKHGKNWMEVAKGTGTKTDLQCENFYKSFRRKHNLDQLMEERPNDDKKREHRVSIAESLGSTITAPSDDDLVVPSSDGENDADESSDTASASENEDGPLRGGGRREKTREQAAVSEKKTENGESVPKDPSGKTNSGNSSGLENEQGLPLVKESDKSLRTASGEGEGKTDLEVVVVGLNPRGNLWRRMVIRAPPGQARDRVSSSEDDTKLSELKAKLEVARTDNKADNSKDSPKASLAETAEKMKTMMAEAQKESEEKSMEGKSWGAQGILNMRDLIDSAIHKHLGQEQRGNEKSPMTDGGVEDETEVPSDKGVETSKPSSTQSLELQSDGPKDSATPTGKTPPTDRHEVKVTVTTAEQTQASAMNKTSHITHTSQVSRDVYEVSSSHRPPPGHKPRLTSSAYMDSLPNRSGGLLLEVAAAHVPSTASMGAMPHVSGIPRGASPRGASPHGAERDQQGHLHSPPGRHNYSPRSTSSSPYEAPGSKAQNERLIMRARSRSPATSSPHHEYTGGSIIQGTPVTRREQTASGRAAGHHQHDRISEKEAAHSKEAYHPKAPRVKLEPPPGPEKGGWGLPMVSYDGLNLELIKSLNERDVALKMSDPSMLYMYTQRHLMQYGGEYGQGMVRGQYASEAYNSSKATLADDFATAQRMNQRMPLPTTLHQ
ncbi:putative serine/arginine repetitive matrix protein 2 isoform X4 [Apostichopus japonicus]|uniref:Putative serine/arginine repetitive matrix protein 2 isoform X4 n=1 Tax=Stichopus japonicus TaxID=307972 RepID=A0A2G8JFH6_STIJA|nr:putative serine/arginine repetitive matrix protein 2 isoform X4 [Apostichopus japonicus]